LVIDVDTGVDDALALGVLVARAPQLLAVTTVAGNVPLAYATPNSLKVLAWLGASDIPVHAGASRPLAVPYHDASHVHGGNGLGNAELPDSDRSLAEGNAIDTLLNLAERHAGALTLLATGPLTNVAIAMNLRPELTAQIRRIVIMGGSFFNPGNVTPHAEFNIYADPHAAAQVFAAPWNDIIAVGLDVTHQTVINRATWDAIPEEAPPGATLAKAILRRSYEERGLEGFFLHDPLSALVALDPEIVSIARGSVDVVLDGDERGKTLFREGKGHVAVATGVAADAAERTICEALGIRWIADPGATSNSE
jgi:purine nucleosidase